MTWGLRSHFDCFFYPGDRDGLVAMSSGSARMLEWISRVGEGIRGLGELLPRPILNEQVPINTYLDVLHSLPGLRF